MSINVKEEMREVMVNEIEAGAVEELVVRVPKKSGFVKFSYSSEDAFIRFEAIKDAQKYLDEKINSTGGNMNMQLVDAYEGLNSVMEHIKELEAEIIRLGR